MEKYKCEICKELFTRSGLRYHKNKKIPCARLVKNENKTDEIFKDISELRCPYCKLDFTRKNNLTKHICCYCKEVKNIEAKETQIKEKEMQKQIDDLKKEMNEIKEKKKKTKEINIKNNTNSNNNNTNSNNNIEIDNNNNIIINNYQKNQFPAFTQDEILTVLRRGYNSIQELTKMTHFNEKYPEMHNIYVPKISENICMIQENNNWKAKNRNNVIDDLYEEKRDYIQNNADTYKEILGEKKYGVIKNFLDDTKDSDDIDTVEIKKDLKFLLFNNKYMVIERKKLVEKQILK